MHSSLLRRSSVCLISILISTLVLAQSNSAWIVGQPSASRISREPQPRILTNRVAPVAQRGARALQANARRPAASALSGLAFAPVVTYGFGRSFPNFVAVADVNRDGKPDLLVANQCTSDCANNSDGSVGVLLGNGDGTFQAGVFYDSGGQNTISVAVADVSGDVRPDVIAASPRNNSGVPPGPVGVLLGDGDGTFQPVVTYDAGGAWGSVAVEDLNGDGKPDIVVVNGDYQVGVLLGNGDGTFQPAVNHTTGGSEANFVAVADVNGDGKPDVLVASECASNGNCTIGTVSVLLGNGDGTLETAVTYDSGGNTALSVAVADVNGDGKPDLLVVNVNYCVTDGGCPYNPAIGTVGVLLGNGDGTFQPAVPYGSDGYWAHAVAVADVNGDGKPDLLVANQVHEGCGKTSSSVGVLLGNGDGTFQAAINYCSGDSSVQSVTAADVNGDGKPDLIVAGDSTVGVLINTSVWPYFSVTPASVGLTVQPGGQGTDLITIAPLSVAFGSAIQLSCAVAGPAPMPTCTLSPTSVTLGSRSATSTLTIAAPQHAVLAPTVGRRASWLLYSVWLPLATVGMIPISVTRKERRRSMYCSVLLLIIFSLAACGGGNSNNVTQQPTNYTVTVTATSGMTQHTTQVTVTFQ